MSYHSVVDMDILDVNSLITVSYHGAVDGQRTVVQLVDTVADLDVDTLLAPLDGGQGVSSYLTV